MFRRALLATAILLAVSALVSATGTTERMAAEVQELRVMWWGGQLRHDSTLEVIDLFEARNAGVRIQPEFSGWGGYWERLATQAAGGQLPGVVQTAIASGWGNQYAEQGLFADMYPMIEQGWIDVQHVDDGTLAQNVIAGKLYGIPLGVNAPVFLYDRTAIEQSGMRLPDDSWTFEEFGDYLNEFADRTGTYGIDNFFAMNDLFPVYLRNHGYSFIDAEENRLGYDDDALLTGFWDLVLRMQEGRGSAPPDLAEESTPIDARLVLSGRAAMTFMFSNQAEAIANGVGGPVGLAMVPGPNQHQGMFIKSALDFSIATNPRTEQVAARFVDFFTNDADANIILNAERGVPISSEIRDLLTVDATDSMLMTLEYIDRVSAISPQPLDFPHPAFAEVGALLTDIEARVRYEQITPREGAALFRTEAEAVLRRVTR